MEIEREEVLTDELVAQVRVAAQCLEEHGWACIEGILTQEEIAQYREDLWQFLGAISNDKFHRDADFKSMKSTELPTHQHGIIISKGFNHAWFVRRLRQHNKVLAVFALLFGTDQLTGSMDRVNVKFPGRQYKSTAPWAHADQNARLIHRILVQSYVTLYDAAENSPGNRFYQGSHLRFATEWADMRVSGKVGWLRPTPERLTELEKTCPLVKPVCPAGSLLLWDSRTIHSPSDGVQSGDGQDLNGRFVIYLCYSPLWEKAGDEKFMKEKSTAFDDLRSTSHSPVPQEKFPPHPRAYGGGPVAYSEISPTHLRLEARTTEEDYLFCFKSYAREEGHLLGADWKERSGIADELPLLKFHSPFTPLLPAIKSEKTLKPTTQKKSKKL